MWLFVILGLFSILTCWPAVEGSCDISKCSFVIYQDCPAANACGTSSTGVSCGYIPAGISGSNCGWNKCPAIVGNGAWQTSCTGIDAIDIIGPCKAQLARQTGGVRPYAKVFQPGFNGVWNTYENGVNFGDNVQSVKLSCADTDECALSSTNNCSSNAICTNTVGSYSCSCKSGFNGNGLTCSDVDECQLGTHNCSSNADCTNTIGGHTCACKLGYYGNGSHCDDGNNRVVCDENMMMIFLDARAQLTNGSSITLRNSSCVATKYAPSNEYGLITTYDICGTTKRETTTHIVYENEAIWTFGSSTSGITRLTGKKIKFSCSFERHRDTVAMQVAPTTTYITASEAGYGQFSVSLSMHSTSAFNTTVTSFPVVVALGDRVYFEASVGTNDTDVVALIEKCSASPTTTKNHPSSYVIIKNRCPSESSTKFHYSNSNHKVRFSLESFAFVGMPHNAVYIHCQIFMCHKLSSDSRCSTACQVNHFRRLRRYISDDATEEHGLVDNAASQLVAKKIQRRDVSNKNFPPSKTYNLNIGPLQFKSNANTNNDKPTGKGNKKSFSATHGLIIAVSVLGAALAAVAVKFTLKWRQRSQGCGSKSSANEQNPGTANQGFESF